MLNGLQVWRKLAVPQASKSLRRRFVLRDQIQNPKQCSSFGAVLGQLKTWQKDLTSYISVGRTMPSDEDKRYTFMKMLPGTLSLEMKSKANGKETDESVDRTVEAECGASESDGKYHGLGQ